MIHGIHQQIQQLNKMVLDYCIFHVYSEAQGYMKYLQDASTLYRPMALPVMLAVASFGLVAYKKRM